MSYLTDRARATGLGSAKDGTGHFWSQRITAIALVPLGLLFVFPFAIALGDGYEAVRALYGAPYHAIVAGLFIVVAFNHLRLGIQVVVEDYVHGGARTVILVLNTLFCALFAFGGLFAVARIAFAG
ncbi:succinate dehydrogenase, hydrophobic membrane anchor protein [Pikeienuella piscinae]|uniref:Succinate dehydrogenase hydrophobic membrane anchor subunit n=1 Tax=Pikeienuella piscinae TaxID=2748098 RepID=A0A7L5BZB4_9RHOB|nr:succinate dehydrogenase, hydrophobic membrane anchor protein [Pikeienuella piscinae]QIE56821.1 succinate dehydrogenase, hydrophobic membrane anchor protein [Pikeienuella piscinae]